MAFFRGSAKGLRAGEDAKKGDASRKTPPLFLYRPLARRDHYFAAESSTR
jgi:hypothetical protein